MWNGSESLRIMDQLTKAYQLINNNDEDFDYQLPIMEILQNPYILVNEEISCLLSNLISAIHDKSESVEKLPWDTDVDYPGLFVLLVSNNNKVVLSREKNLRQLSILLLFPLIF